MTESGFSKISEQAPQTAKKIWGSIRSGIQKLFVGTIPFLSLIGPVSSPSVPAFLQPRHGEFGHIDKTDSNIATTQEHRIDKHHQQLHQRALLLGSTSKSGFNSILEQAAGPLPGYEAYAGVILRGENAPLYYGTEVSTGLILQKAQEIPSIVNVYLNSRFSNLLSETVLLFHSEFSDSEVTTYLQNYSVAHGQGVDTYLSIGRHGSHGSTLLTINADGTVQVTSISLLSQYIHGQMDSKTTERMVTEETVQSLQYNEFSNLFNSGYLAEVDGTHTAEQLAAGFTNGRYRTFLELIQQEYLTQHGVLNCSYLFKVGSNGQPPTSGNSWDVAVVHDSFTQLQRVIQSLGFATVTPEDLFFSENLQIINDAFRVQYGAYYASLGFDDTEIQIWNIIGMQRPGTGDRTLNIDPLLPIP